MKQLIVTCLLVFFTVSIWAQPNAEAELAERYYVDGEYESALELFEKIHRKNPDEKYALRIVSCYEFLTRFEDGIAFLDKAMKRSRTNVLFPVLKASMLEKIGELKASDKLYDDVIQKRLSTVGHFIKVGAFLYQAGKLDLSNQTYLQGRKRLKDPLYLQQ